MKCEPAQLHAQATLHQYSASMLDHLHTRFTWPRTYWRRADWWGTGHRGW